jgi:glyoxylase-like metal-dependent hydrolase (beta-lactamase superfamily II)
MARKHRLGGALLTVALVVASAEAQRAAPAPSSPRIYVLENGTISGLDPALFNFRREELQQVDFVNMAYLIVHPRGTLMFDAGAVPDSHFEGDGTPVVDGVVTATKPVLPQLVAAGYAPRDVTYFALSHFHSDHTGNANEFASATWIVQKAERDYMFADAPQGIIQPATYAALRNAETKILNNEDFDVFGDGSVVVLATPGHTPGHQALAVKLAKRGTVVLAGDLYHYPEERATGRTPTFEFDAEQSKISRARIEKYLEDNDAELWIEHDIATHAALPKSPLYVE